MNSDFIRTSLQAIALCVAAIGGYGQTTISSLPFTITQSGTYTFSQVLTFSSVGGGQAITIAASNVVIDLKGYELKANPTGAGRGIESSNRFVNLIIRNGTISGFQFGVAVLNVTTGCTIQNVQFSNNETSINLQNSVSCIVQNCLVFGTGAGTGIQVSGCEGVQVKNTQLANWAFGVTSDGGNAFLENYIGGCSTGLQLGTGDKYQGNVTSGCATPFSGGTAAGTENN
jgi:hypothetical protein